uniref:UBA domain-containing protein n=1 Tax=Strigops habroptila TaxID=2489341 RepID=A0A672TJ12_STRHB
MMTSVGSERTWSTRDKTQISTTQPTQPQKQVVQATAEQIRLAQMIYDKNDADFEDKVKQLIEVTGENQDECIVALHDCNGDVNRAINILLEGSSDTVSFYFDIKPLCLLPFSSTSTKFFCLVLLFTSYDSEAARVCELSCLNAETLSSLEACKAPPNLPQGVPHLLHNQYIVGPGGLLPAYPLCYDGSLANNPYSGDITKFGRGDSASPAPTTTLAQPQQNQTQTHHTTQQPFLNPTLPPGYSYTGLPYYAGVPGIPSAFQYGPTMFVSPASAKQHGVNLNTASTSFQQVSGYGQHGYGAGYEDLTQGTAAGDYSKGGYSGSAQAQNKSAGTGPGKGVSVTSSNTGVPDISGSVYNKTQTFDKQGFHAGTPPPFSLPSALGSTGPLNPGAAPGYAPAPFLHILPAHQQPHSQMLHHHLQQDGQVSWPIPHLQCAQGQIAPTRIPARTWGFLLMSGFCFAHWERALTMIADC